MAADTRDLRAHEGTTCTRWRDELRRLAEETLAEVGEQAERTTVDRSSAARGLHDLAEHDQADLIVVGSRHRGPIGRVPAGSRRRALLHGARCGVDIAPAGFAAREVSTLGVLGFGYDGASESEVLLAGAIELAAAAASVRIVALVKPPSSRSPPRATCPPANTRSSPKPPRDSERRRRGARTSPLTSRRRPR